MTSSNKPMRATAPEPYRRLGRSVGRRRQMVQCEQCSNVFRVIGDALNLRLDTSVLLEMAARSFVEQFNLKGCHFRVLSRDQQTLDHMASHGLSQSFLDKGPVDAERSVNEALEGKVVAVSDCINDPRVQYPKAFASEGIASMLTVPLETRGQVIGVMRLMTSERREFAEDEIEFFKMTALFCTSAIIDSMFHNILGHVTEAIQESLELSVVLDNIVTVVSEDLRTKGCAISLVDGTKQNLETRASNGLSEGFVERLAEVVSKETRDEVIAGASVAIFDGCNDKRILQPEVVEHEGISSILLVPLMCRGKIIGVLSLFTYNPYLFSSDEKQLMRSIGEQCSLAIDNAMMFEALKKRYENLVDDFQLWFEHTQGYGQRGSMA
jgi:GAF domain-containing protein